MAATVVITESNDSSGEVLTVATSTNFGAVDEPNIADPTAIGYRLSPSTNSYEKEQRLHVTAMGGSAAVDGLKIWATPPGNAGGLTHKFNGHTVQGTYDGSKRTSYAAPVATTGNVPNTAPTSEPASPNLGIAGSLTGQLLAAGYSDYLLHQVQVGASPTHADSDPIEYTVAYAYEETI
jgi:hypothetical protein